MYDGDCSMCMALVAMLKRQDDGRGLISFVNIASMAYNPRENEGEPGASYGRHLQRV